MRRSLVVLLLQMIACDGSENEDPFGKGGGDGDDENAELCEGSGSFASSHGEGDCDTVGGPGWSGTKLPGESCEQASECRPTCCSCDNSEAVFVAAYCVTVDPASPANPKECASAEQTCAQPMCDGEDDYLATCPPSWPRDR